MISKRPNLSSDLAEHLRALIIAGDMPSGERINEVHLARELNVSRTPLREALSRLMADGFIEQQPRKGFFVRELQATEIDELYQIRAVLDPAALKLAGIPSAEQMEQLDILNQQLEKASGNTSLVIELDDCWHLKLLEHCPNGILLDLIRDYMRKTRRYEHVYLNSLSHVAVALDEHETILRHLRHDDLESACQALWQNMQSAVPQLVAWFSSRDSRNS